MQKGKVIANALSQLKTLEKKYATHDLELAVVAFVWILWRQYLYIVYCEVFIDCHKLQYIFNHNDLTLREIKWIVFLKDYDLTNLYHTVKANLLANALCRKTSIVGIISSIL